MCVCIPCVCLYVCVHTMCKVPDVHESQERESDHSELELQMVVSPHVDTGNGEMLMITDPILQPQLPYVLNEVNGTHCFM